MILILLLIVTLGLAIFASLPRVPGYQLRTFPVSASNQVEEADQQEIDGIANPGYVREGNPQSDGEGTGGRGSEGVRGRAGNHFPTLPFGTGLATFTASG
ncbi:MAG: hypothetical protein GDA38_26735, partial [Hormoscilla sp. SP12CHS1]|nr:hypothetical protein [Hormoscilla sp. SP12CHS1]